MNRFAVLLPRLTVFSMLVASLLPTGARATPLVNDPFDYANGPLVGHGGWIAHNSAGLKPVQVTGGTIRLVQSFGSGEDVSLAFPARPATAKTYAGFTLSVPAGASGGSFEYITHFRQAAPDTLVYRSRAYVGSLTATSYQLGLTSTSAGVGHPIVPWPNPLSYGATYRVVQSYDGATGASELWVEPVDEASPKISSTSAAAAGNAVGSFAFRQGSLNTSFQDIGVLRIGTPFADALPPKEVPGLSVWGMMALAGALAGVGGRLALRRPREAEARG